MRCAACGASFGPATPGPPAAGVCPACAPTLAPGSEPPSPGEAETLRPPPAVEETATAATPTGSAGGTFGRYRLLARLGGGAMGVVWRACDETTGRWVALKQILGNAAGDEAVAERFLREARLAARLRHPGIVGVHDVGRQDGVLYLVLELVEGRSLRALLDEAVAAHGGRLPADRLRVEIDRLAQVAEAVGHAHSEGVVHRDLKPANVMVDAAGRARVTDFGLAKDVNAVGRAGPERALTLSGDLLGTPAYMSPEQALGESLVAGPETDVWSLGVMLFELLTGELPFRAGDVMAMVRRIRREEAPRPSARASGVDPDLEAICLRALERPREARYPHAGEFAAELRRWLAGAPVRTRRRGRIERARRWATRHPVLLGVSFAAALLLLWGATKRWDRRARERQALVDLAATAASFEDSLFAGDLTRETREAAIDQILAQIDHRLQDDADLGVVWSWRGALRDLADREGSESDFGEGCRRSPESPVVWALRGIARVQRHLNARPAPSTVLVGGRVRIQRPAGGAHGNPELLASGLADLAVVERLDLREMPEALSGVVALGRAMAAYASDRPGGSEEALRLLAGVDSSPAWKLAGLALLSLRRPAADAFGRALARRPGDGSARRLHALALIAEADGATDATERLTALESALEDLKLARRADAASADGLYLTAVAEDRLSQDPAVDPERSAALEQAAFADVTTVVTAHPDHGPAWFLRARIRQQRVAAQARRGEDAREEASRAIADLDQALATGCDPSVTRHNRGNAWLEMERLRARHGGDREECRRRAEEDFRAALESGLGEASFGLAQALHHDGRLAEAEAALADCLARYPDLAADARPRLDLVRQEREVAESDWARELAAGQGHMDRNDYAAAGGCFERAFAAWEEALRAAGSGRARLEAHPAARRRWRVAGYNAACVEALRSQGRAGPEEKPQPVPEPEQRARLDRALDWLEMAVRAGWKDGTGAARDPDLAALRRDPRFAVALQAMAAAADPPEEER